jgi:hypothetical protein
VADGASVDVLAERIKGLRDDVQELSEEQKRSRGRLHDLEGLAAAWADTQNVNRRAEARQYRRLELRIQVLSVAVGFAAVASPILVAYLTGK